MSSSNNCVCWTCVETFRKPRHLERHNWCHEHLERLTRYACEELEDGDLELDKKRIDLFETLTGIKLEEKLKKRKNFNRKISLYFCRCVFDWKLEKCHTCGEKDGYLTHDDKKQLTARIFEGTERDRQESENARRRRSSLKIPDMSALSALPDKVVVEKKTFHDVTLLDKIKQTAAAFRQKFTLTPEERRRRSPLRKSTERAKVRAIGPFEF